MPERRRRACITRGVPVGTGAGEDGILGGADELSGEPGGSADNAGFGVAAQAVSMQYVNSELATKADDGSVVHLNGTETISGTKTFANAPNVPAPTGTGQVANKAYVDQAVANVGAGNYLSTAGGTMTGPITLPGNALATVDAVAAREIVNPEKFREGISKIIDGTVECLNASTWAKGATRLRP